MIEDDVAALTGGGGYPFVECAESTLAWFLVLLLAAVACAVFSAFCAVVIDACAFASVWSFCADVRSCCACETPTLALVDVVLDLAWVTCLAATLLLAAATSAELFAAACALATFFCAF